MVHDAPDAIGTSLHNAKVGAVSATIGEVLDGLWRFVSVHPDWESDADGWDPDVAWWAIRTPDGVVLVDPLVEDWDALDRLIDDHGGCAAVARTLYWHQRHVTEAAARYGAEIWARPASADAEPRRLDRAIEGDPITGQELPGGLIAHEVVRADEVVLWLPDHSALLFGDLVVRSRDGDLTLCPDGWIDRAGGPEAMRAVLRGLPAYPVEHVLVSHGPLVLGDGGAAFARVVSP